MVTLQIELVLVGMKTGGRNHAWSVGLIELEKPDNHVVSKVTEKVGPRASDSTNVKRNNFRQMSSEIKAYHQTGT